METIEQRKHLRLRWSFPVSLRKDGLEDWVEGTSVNVSQRGAFIVTDSGHLFKAPDRTLIIWHLPTEFTGQRETVRLAGEALIRRVDHERGGVALEFMKHFKTFERIDG
jgi:hypothetical protein